MTNPPSYGTFFPNGFARHSRIKTLQGYSRIALFTIIYRSVGGKIVHARVDLTTERFLAYLNHY